MTLLREVAAGIVRNNIKASRAEWRELVGDAFKSPGYHASLFDEWWERNEPYLRAIPPEDSATHKPTAYFEERRNFVDVPPAERPKAVVRTLADRRKARADAQSKATQLIATVCLLDMAMPNGKKLRDCTFMYVAKLSGWFKDLSRVKGCRPGDTIGAKLKEIDLRNIFQRNVA
jgi:hypothetical protein